MQEAGAHDRAEKVADLNNPTSPQPNRVPVRASVAAILRDAPRCDKSGYPLAFTHHELATLVYGTEQPQATHESAVRRAVAALVVAGQAERLTEDRPLNRRRAGLHVRTARDGYNQFYASNPAGIVVRRTLTADDREARALVAERAGYTDYAARIRNGETL